VFHGAAAELDDRQLIAERADVAEGFDEDVSFADGIVHGPLSRRWPGAGRQPHQVPFGKRMIVGRWQEVSMERVVGRGGGFWHELAENPRPPPPPGGRLDPS